MDIDFNRLKERSKAIIENKELSDKIIRAFYNVYNKLGYGFLEKVYEKAMLIELEKLDVRCSAQKQIKVYYDQQEVGEYYADILVESKIIIELKATKNISEQHEAQLLNYLKASDIEIGLVLNFGEKPEFKRKYLSNKTKEIRLNPLNP